MLHNVIGLYRRTIRMQLYSVDQSELVAPPHRLAHAGEALAVRGGALGVAAHAQKQQVGQVESTVILFHN